MGWEKERTPRSVERHAANRAENETRHGLNVVRLQEAGLYRGHGQDRPSRVLRRIERERKRQESAALLERIEGAYTDGGDAA